jgi:hypothetical protein
MKTRTQLPDAVLKYFKEQGSRGGRKRAKNLSKKQRSEQARKAVQTRWAKSKSKSKIKKTTKQD